MPLYELVLVLPSSGTEQERSNTIERIEGVITKHGGEIESKDDWGKRKLAYPVQKLREGYYTQINFNAETEGECLIELDRELRIAEDILRFLVTRAVVGKSKGKPLTPEEMAKMNYRPPGSRRPPHAGGPRRFDNRDGNRDNRDGNRDNRDSSSSSSSNSSDSSSESKPAPAAAATEQKSSD